MPRILDIGCGAGNNAISLARQSGGTVACDLCDLSGPMLKRAQERLSRETKGKTRVFEGDFRAIDLQESSYDVIVAAAVLHHLRDDFDWENAFGKIHRLLRPEGNFWITDLVSHENPEIQELMWARYACYLESLGGADYPQKVFDYIDREDSPRPLT